MVIITAIFLNVTMRVIAAIIQKWKKEKLSQKKATAKRPLVRRQKHNQELLQESKSRVKLKKQTPGKSRCNFSNYNDIYTVTEQDPTVKNKVKETVK